MTLSVTVDIPDDVLAGVVRALKMSGWMQASGMANPSALEAFALQVLRALPAEARAKVFGPRKAVAFLDLDTEVKARSPCSRRHPHDAPRSD